MTHCCNTNSSIPGKAVCPINGQLYAQISRRAVLHQVRQPWRRDLTAQQYYFCDDSNCEVVYFGDDQQVILQHDVRQPVGQKSTAPDKPVCYCFDIRLTDLQTDNDRIRLKTFVTEQTRSSACDCEIRNPSGKCCLRDFPNK
jgi:hypothetical protein